MFAAFVISLLTIGQPVPPPPANCPDGKCPLVKSNSVSAFSSVQQGNNFATTSYSSNYSKVSLSGSNCDCVRHPIRNLLKAEVRIVNAARPVNLVRR